MSRKVGGIGIVDLVGAGPGDPGLLTRRGAEVLALADVVVYDHLIHDRLLDLAPPEALRIFAGKARGRCPVPQEEINALLVEHAKVGKRVVRLKGGDPYVFGRGAEEAEHLHAEGIPYRVVPGVTAAVGATCYAGVPVTHREHASAVAFVTGHNDPAEQPPRLDWPALARFPGTLVFYMGYRWHAEICKTLIELGKPANTPAALIQAGTRADQATLTGTLANLPEQVARANMGPPALLIVGEVVSKRPALAWFESLPLFGQRIVLTRPQGETDRSASDLEALGAEVLVAPTVQILPIEATGPLDRSIDELTTYDWLVFTSGNGVRHFFERLNQRGGDLRRVGHLRLAAIGPATAEALAQYHLKADLVPDSYRSEALAEALAPHVAGRSVLLARADRGRTILKDELQGIASRVEQVAVYQNTDAESLPPQVAERLAAGSVDWITLTSSAITNRLHALLPENTRQRIANGQIRLASLSPVTSESTRQLGWPVAVEAQQSTWDGLLRALLDASFNPSSLEPR